jgi:hypothetical protein
VAYRSEDDRLVAVPAWCLFGVHLGAIVARSWHDLGGEHASKIVAKYKQFGTILVDMGTKYLYNRSYGGRSSGAYPSPQDDAP